jgi:hypothetical protein
MLIFVPSSQEARNKASLWIPLESPGLGISFRGTKHIQGVPIAVMSRAKRTKALHVSDIQVERSTVREASRIQK